MLVYRNGNCIHHEHSMINIELIREIFLLQTSEYVICISVFVHSLQSVII